MQIAVRFGHRVRSVRKLRGFSQEQLAEHCGLHRTYIGSVERGERNITLVNAQKIAEALSVSLCDLVQENE
ncbi:MAG: helix-turn-helix domain-containing protein [Phormidium sp. PBR-2020]|nr:MAG: helix-turn-helix domain-containing protein [Phormidium sp. PBR-2020]